MRTGFGSSSPPDDGDDFVDVQKRNQAPFEQVQSCFDAFESVCDSLSDRVRPKQEPLFEQ